MKKLFFTITLTFLLSLSFFTPVLAVDNSGMPALTNPTDKLQIQIPGLDLGEIYCTGSHETKDRQCAVPWLANYIAGIYKYLLGIAAVLATITMMIGGFRWVISTGNPQSITEAKAWINGSIVGLIILFTSWVLLTQVNPDLTRLKSIKVAILAQEDADETLPLDIPSVPSSWTTIPPNDKIIYDANVNKTSRADSVAKIIEVANSECIKNANIKLRISDTSRTVDQQKALYDKNCPDNGGRCLSKCSVPTCCPYMSSSLVCPHNSGLAFDIHPSPQNETTIYALQDCMQEKGFCLLASEFWHYEYPPQSGNCTSKVGNHNLKYFK